MIKHIVMWKFKENEEENMKLFLEGLNKLKGIIPEIKNMETGININPKNVNKILTFFRRHRYGHHCAFSGPQRYCRL